MLLSLRNFKATYNHIAVLFNRSQIGLGDIVQKGAVAERAGCVSGDGKFLAES